MVNYHYDKEVYMHGHCQYFAIAFAELFKCKVCLWLDFDEIRERTVLCHAFCELQPHLYVDSYGVFTDIAEREDEFEFNLQRIVSGTVDEMKLVLKTMKIPYTNVESKRNVREYLRNNMLLFNMGEYGYYGLFYSEYGKGLGMVGYDLHKKVFHQYVTRFNFVDFMKINKKFLGFYENPKWYYKQ